MKPGFEDFARAQADVMSRTAYLLTGSRDDAEDLVQDSLLLAYRHWGKIRKARNPNGYVYRLMVNTFLSGQRSRRLRTVTLPEVEEWSSEQGDFANESAARDTLKRALARLPARERTAVVLRHYQGLTHAEIAAVMQISESAVRGTVSKGMKSLRETLAQTSDGSMEEDYEHQR